MGTEPSGALGYPGVGDRVTTAAPAQCPPPTLKSTPHPGTQVPLPHLAPPRSPLPSTSSPLPAPTSSLHPKHPPHQGPPRGHPTLQGGAEVLPALVEVAAGAHEAADDGGDDGDEEHDGRGDARDGPGAAGHTGTWQGGQTPLLHSVTLGAHSTQGHPRNTQLRGQGHPEKHQVPVTSTQRHCPVSSTQHPAPNIQHPAPIAEAQHPAPSAHAGGT